MLAAAFVVALFATLLAVLHHAMVLVLAAHFLFVLLVGTLSVIFLRSWRFRSSTTTNAGASTERADWPPLSKGQVVLEPLAQFWTAGPHESSTAEAEPAVAAVMTMAVAAIAISLIGVLLTY